MKRVVDIRIRSTIDNRVRALNIWIRALIVHIRVMKIWIRVCNVRIRALKMSIRVLSRSRAIEGRLIILSYRSLRCQNVSIICMHFQRLIVQIKVVLCRLGISFLVV